MQDEEQQQPEEQTPEQQQAEEQQAPEERPPSEGGTPERGEGESDESPPEEALAEDAAAEDDTPAEEAPEDQTPESAAERPPASPAQPGGKREEVVPGAELDPIAIEPERELDAEERARREAEAEERARRERELIGDVEEVAPVAAKPAKLSGDASYAATGKRKSSVARAAASPARLRPSATASPALSATWIQRCGPSSSAGEC